MFEYFVSYLYTKKGTGFGFGNVDISVNFPMTDIDTVRAVEKHIIEKNGFERCVIMNFRLLQDVEQ